MSHDFQMLFILILLKLRLQPIMLYRWKFSTWSLSKNWWSFFGYLPFWRLLHQWGFVLLWDFVFDHSLVLVCIRPFQASDKFPQGIQHDNQLYIQSEFHWTFQVFLKKKIIKMNSEWRAFKDRVNNRPWFKIRFESEIFSSFESKLLTLMLTFLFI